MYGIISKGENRLKDFFDFVNSNGDYMTTQESKNHNVLTFAFVGDAIWSLFVRTYLAVKTTAKAGTLHTQTTQFVRAKFQSFLIDFLLPNLTEQESSVVKTARNAHTNNIAKHSSLQEYKKSTSFEALLGFLYLTHQNQRLRQILDLCAQKMEIEK